MKKNLLGVSVLTMGCLLGMLSIFVFLFAMLCDLNLEVAIISIIILFILQFLFSPVLTDLTMKCFYKASFNYEIPKYLKEFIEEVCKSNKMKYPRIGFIDDGSPNAFTYGSTKNSSRIILTRGIFDLLSESEVKAVVAHELGHAVHYDMAVMTMAQLVPLFFYYAYEVLTDDDSDDEDGASLAGLGYIALLFYAISQFLILGLSRTREYYADEFSIKVTKSPTTLADALVKIGFGLTTKSNRKGRLSAGKANALGIMDSNNSKSLVVCNYNDGKVDKKNIKMAMRWEKWNVWAKWYEIFSTHPLITNRLEAISTKCSEYGEEEYIKYDEVQPESYVDDFIGEVLLIAMPYILAIAFIIIPFIATLYDEPALLSLCFFIPFLQVLFFYIKFLSAHSKKEFKLTKISDLLGEIKVSGITSIPCVVEGQVIGRGDPGNIFNEDFIIKDDTGIMLIDSKRVLRVMDYFDGISKTRKLFNKKIRIKGWYRRAPYPYIQIYEMNIEGEKKKRFHLYGIQNFLFIFLLLILLLIPFAFILFYFMTV